MNHKRIYRLYRQLGLQMRYKSPKRRIRAQLRGDRSVAVRPNQCWSMDFMADQLFDGRRIRLLTIVDNFSRISPLLGAGFSYKGHDVVASLQLACSCYGKPERIRVDNGPEFVSKDLDLWAYTNNVVLDFSRPGKPPDNAFIESFNGRFRDECLNQHWFLTLKDVQAKIESWRIDYNTVRPHSALAGMSPEQYYRRYLKESKLPLASVGSGGVSGGNCEAHSRCPQALEVG